MKDNLFRSIRALFILLMVFLFASILNAVAEGTESIQIIPTYESDIYYAGDGVGFSFSFEGGTEPLWCEYKYEYFKDGKWTDRFEKPAKYGGKTLIPPDRTYSFGLSSGSAKNDGFTKIRFCIQVTDANGNMAEWISNEIPIVWITYDSQVSEITMGLGETVIVKDIAFADELYVNRPEAVSPNIDLIQTSVKTDWDLQRGCVYSLAISAKYFSTPPSLKPPVSYDLQVYTPDQGLIKTIRVNVVEKSSAQEAVEKIQSFVKRCYSLILGRVADNGGLNSWSNALSLREAAAANIIDGFVKSDEFINRKLSDEAKVDILYKTMLNREADAGGKAGWVDALNQGYTLANIIDGFCGSTEFVNLCNSYGIEPGSIGAPTPASPSSPRGKIEAFVKRCYQLILNRQADDGGLKGWSDALEGKTAAAAQIIDGFVRSPEYINRSLTSEQSVTILYKTMLDRDPDEGGKAGWVDALGKGYTLQHIINGFCGSAEFTKICSDYGIQAGSVAVPVRSAAVLEAAAQLEAKKLPDERIGNAVSADDAGITVVNGYEPAEVEAFVKHAYRAALGREADEAGLAGWTEQIVSGAAAPKAFLRTLLFSDEQIARKLNNEQFIEMLYRLYLNRGMDDAAAERIAQLAAGGLDEVIKGFEGSAEFRLVLNGFGL